MKITNLSDTARGASNNCSDRVSFKLCKLASRRPIESQRLACVQGLLRQGLQKNLPALTMMGKYVI